MNRCWYLRLARLTGLITRSLDRLAERAALHHLTAILIRKSQA